MKKVLLFALLLSTLSFSQTQFDYLGGLGMSANGTGCFFIDLNTGNTGLGINDVKFIHEGGEIYFCAVAGDSMRLPAKAGKAWYPNKLWLECDILNNQFTENKAHIITTGVQRLSNGSHVLPFKYNDLYNYIVLRVSGDSVYIRGWQFNIPEEVYECFSLADAKKLYNQPKEFIKPKE